MRLAIPLLLALVACRTPSEPPSILPRLDAALSRAHAYLLAQQGEDGAWRSTTYGALKDGYALTPLAMSVLLYAPPTPAYARGADFLATIEQAEYLDYPVYSLAGAILVLSVEQNQRHFAVRDRLLSRLLERQLDENNGWSPADLSYGGWGYFHEIPSKREPVEELLSSNVASTLFAIGALALGGLPLEDAAFAKARTFVERLQNLDGDGGFFFTPAHDIQNKAGGTAGAYRSYGTATADGLRALLRLGADREGARVTRASEWLFSRFSAERVPGDYAEDREVQRDSAYYYWTWSAAHALLLLGPRALTDPRTQHWPEQLAAALLARQRADGSWKNDATDLREDDPLVATPLAAASLSICRLVYLR